VDEAGALGMSKHVDARADDFGNHWVGSRRPDKTPGSEAVRHSRSGASRLVSKHHVAGSDDGPAHPGLEAETENTPVSWDRPASWD
jgi:hypothetical protein